MTEIIIMLGPFESRAARFIASRFTHLICNTFFALLLIAAVVTWPHSALAGQHWGSLQDNGCKGIGIRTYSSRLWDIPWGQNWTTACQGASITINSQTYPSPTRCIDLGAGGEWGEWDISDNGCKPYWGSLQDNGCSSTGTHKFAARLWNIQPGQDWNAACQGTSITIQGQTYASPTRCIDQGVGGEWGEWDIPDSACKAYWGGLQDNGCSSAGIRTFAARLWNIPPGQSWGVACQGTPITIQGQTFASPIRCVDRGIAGEWGEWDISDNACNPSPSPAITFSPTITYVDANGYSYNETSDKWKQLCSGLPCFAALQWPDYATMAFDDVINGQPVVIQVWKGWCQKFLGLQSFPGGIGAEVGVYHKMPGRARPRSLRFVPKPLADYTLSAIANLSDNEIWWPYPELNTQIEFTLVNPVTNQTFFTAGPETSYWLAKWMDDGSYLKYQSAQGKRYFWLPPGPSNSRTPWFAVDYKLDYKINGKSYPRW
jgi:hypothetical protein